VSPLAYKKLLKDILRTFVWPMHLNYENLTDTAKIIFAIRQAYPNNDNKNSCLQNRANVVNIFEEHIIVISEISFLCSLLATVMAYFVKVVNYECKSLMALTTGLCIKTLRAEICLDLN